MWILGCRAVQVNKLKCCCPTTLEMSLACGFTLPPGKFHKAACARLTIPESGSETRLDFQRSKEGANVKPTFCHQTPPTPEVGEACRLHRTNHGGREATRTSCETKKIIGPYTVSFPVQDGMAGPNAYSWNLRWEPRGLGPPDCATKFHSTDNRRHSRQPGAGTADSSGWVCGCSEEYAVQSTTSASSTRSCSR